ncbi:hypothetical protein NCS52_00592400 [Fusarium sp. LHS14.1]|nr:hypothetical protein NCS52_00592400 [Fusarium sp. LHS14.1]
MCCCDLVKFTCNHREWSDVWQSCDDAQAGRECQKQSVRRHIHISTNDVCSKCWRSPFEIDPLRVGLYVKA